MLVWCLRLVLPIGGVFWLDGSFWVPKGSR
jgi:hypothetical protein